MYIMVQAVFSKQLLEDRFKPRNLLSIALCTMDDSVLRPLLKRHYNVRVAIMDAG